MQRKDKILDHRSTCSWKGPLTDAEGAPAACRRRWAAHVTSPWLCCSTPLRSTARSFQDACRGHHWSASDPRLQSPLLARWIPDPDTYVFPQRISLCLFQESPSSIDSPRHAAKQIEWEQRRKSKTRWILLFSGTREKEEEAGAKKKGGVGQIEIEGKKNVEGQQS